MGEVAWYTDNSGGGVKQVGLKDPNELGLYDMSGNVYEWCADWYSGFYSSSPQHDPKNYLVALPCARGGGWLGASFGECLSQLIRQAIAPFVGPPCP